MARIQQAAGLQDPLQNVFPQPVVSNRAPTTSDKNFPIGQIWINKAGTAAYMLTNVSSGSATWAVASPGESEVDSLTPDAGTSPVEPAAGTITLTGGTNITTTGGAAEMTFDLDDAISLATSVTSPLYTVSGADLQITGVAGNDVIITLGDAAGATSFIVEASDGTDLWTVASDGTITFGALTVTGAFEQTGGTFNVGQDNAANAVNIGGGSTARAIAIANGTGAHTLALGNAAAGAITVDTAAGVSVDAATASNFTVTGAAADLTLNSVGGSVNITATEDDAGAILIEADGGTSEAITIHADQGTGTSSIALTSDDGGVTVSAGLASADAINLAASAGGVDIDGALQVNIASSQDAADAIRINASAGGIDIDAAGAAGEDITIDNAAGSISLDAGEADAAAISIQASNAAGGIDVDSGTGGITVDSTAGISLDGATASNFTVTGASEDLTLSSVGGSIAISATEDAASAISLTANGGTSETIVLTASQGTGVDSITLDSTAGGLTLSAGLASDDAINLSASAGGVDIDGALQVNIASSENAADALVLSSSAGGIDITAAGAAGEDIDITCTAGSLNITAGESAADAIVVNASGAAGAIQLNSGTGGVVMDSGQTVNVTAVDHTPDPYVVLGSDYVVACNSSSAAFAITLPGSPATGRKLIFVDSGGSAGANNITINGNGNNITSAGASATSAVIDSNYGTMTLIYTGSIWSGMDVA